jgi:hypothetical protein
MTKAGFRNSDGCRLTPRRVIQRRAPLTSGPNASVAAISARLATNTTSASRRIYRRGRNEVAIITASAGTRYMMCR